MKTAHSISAVGNTAASLATPRVPTVAVGATIAEVRSLLSKRASEFDTINYIYILQRQKIVGVITIKDVFRSSSSTRVATIMTQIVVKVRSKAKQESVALLALKHNLKQIPVVDSAGQFLGVVTHDALMRIISSESLEDFFHISGVYHNISLEEKPGLMVSSALKHRLPWLVIGLAGGVMTAGVIGQFEAILAKHIMLAAFIPLIVYMAAAVGAQVQAFIIRDLALDPKLPFLKYFLRQGVVVTFIGFFLSVLLWCTSLFLFGNFRLSAVFGLSLFIAINTVTLSSLIVPYVFNKLHLDPADAGGPIATIIQDFVSVLVYFAIASVLLK